MKDHPQCKSNKRDRIIWILIIIAWTFFIWDTMLQQAQQVM